jgi:hypothetical protein
MLPREGVTLHSRNRRPRVARKHRSIPVIVSCVVLLSAADAIEAWWPDPDRSGFRTAQVTALVLRQAAFWLDKYSK